MVDPSVTSAAVSYLNRIDGLLPGVVTGFYLVGSVALGAYRADRSDIDFVAVVESDLDPPSMRRLRVQHVRSGVHTALVALRHRRSPLCGTCNGVFVRRQDLRKPVTEIDAVASQTGHEFSTGPTGSDLSPVAWKVLAESAVAVRGPESSLLELDPQPELLRQWNVENLQRYWRPWALSNQDSPTLGFRSRPRWSTAWGVLGPPRLHHTFETGNVISKESAGEYALDVFDKQWHALIGEALAYRRGQPDRLGSTTANRSALTSEFILAVIDATGGQC